MYVIKHNPEDFIVNEVSNFSIEKTGDYAIFELKKRNYTTPDAVTRIAKELHKPIKDIGFAGNKDRKAITTQLISVFKGTPKDMDLELLDIDLTFKGYSSKKVALGELEGNRFTIVVRNLDETDIEKLRSYSSFQTSVPNYFGPQRFSSANHLIGREMVKKNFAQAAKLIIEHDTGQGFKMEAFLKSNPHNSIAAIRLIPLHTLKLYLHSYQSFLFNTLLTQCVNVGVHDIELTLPLIGFGTETSNFPIAQAIDDLLKKEGVGVRDFINRQMPELSSEGEEREAYFSPIDFKVLEVLEDDSFPSKKKATLIFALKKSCYATTLLSFIFDGCSHLFDN